MILLLARRLDGGAEKVKIMKVQICTIITVKSRTTSDEVPERIYFTGIIIRYGMIFDTTEVK